MRATLTLGPLPPAGEGINFLPALKQFARVLTVSSLLKVKISRYS